MASPGAAPALPWALHGVLGGIIRRDQAIRGVGEEKSSPGGFPPPRQLALLGCLIALGSGCGCCWPQP